MTIQDHNYESWGKIMREDIGVIVVGEKSLHSIKMPHIATKGDGLSSIFKAP